MAYEVFQRTGTRVEQPALSLTPDGRVALNAAAVRLFMDARITSVLLLWDKTNHKFALKGASKNDSNAYAVSASRGRASGSLRAQSFFSHIGWNAPKRTTLIATWNEREKMLEVTLPAQYVGSAKSGNERKS